MYETFNRASRAGLAKSSHSPSVSQELATCRDDENKRAWCRQEQWLRNQWERRYDARMDFTLEELNGPKPGAGIAQPPNVNIVHFLNSQR